MVTSFHNTHSPPQTRLTGLPAVRHLRSAYGRLSINYALQHSALITGCSQGVLDALDPHGETIPARRSRVLYLGVNIPAPVTAAERAAFRASCGWPEETPLVLHVGRFVEQKNHLGLLAVFQQVLERLPNARLLLVGDGLLRPAVEAAITQRGLAGAVRLLGLRDDVAALMGKSDVFVFPSLHEGFGLVAIESSAAGLAVVGSRISGLAEAVRDGETGLLHDVADTNGMAASVVKIINDRQLGQRLGSAGRQWVRDEFSAAASARRLLDVYASLAGH